MKNPTKTRVSIPIKIKKELHYFLYYCPVLEVWSVGKTTEEAERRLKEDLQLLLTRCSKHDPIEKILSDCGLTTVEIRA